MSATLISCTKEKNLVVCIARTDSGKDTTYIFDINKGIWTNTITAHTLQSQPIFFRNFDSAESIIRRTLGNTNPILADMILTRIESSAYKAVIYKTADKIDALYRNAGRLAIVTTMSGVALKIIGDNWDEYIKLLNELTPERSTFFRSLEELQTARLSKPVIAEVDKYPWATAYQRNEVIEIITTLMKDRINDYNLPQLCQWLFEMTDFIDINPNTYYVEVNRVDFCTPAIFRLHAREIISYIQNIVRLAANMKVKLENKNLLKQGSHLFAEAQLAADKKINEQLKKQADKYREKLAFENKDFIVIIPTTQDEYQIEADTQNNCVKRLYMSKVADGDTNVVFIREKNNPHKSYITCEINNYGRIVQYLGKYNSRNLSDSARDFQTAYQLHLNRMFNR